MFDVGLLTKFFCFLCRLSCLLACTMEMKHYVQSKKQMNCQFKMAVVMSRLT